MKVMKVQSFLILCVMVLGLFFVFTGCRSDEEWARIFNMKGTLYHQQGHYEDALEEFRKAKIIDPKNNVSDYYRALTLVAMDKCGDAVEAFNLAVDAYGKRLKPSEYVARGNCWLELGEVEFAIWDGYDPAISLEPGAAEWYRKRAQAYLLLGKPEKALKDQEKAEMLS